MRVTTLHFIDSPATASRLSAPIPDPQPGHTTAALTAAREAAWNDFERTTFPDLTR